MKTGIIVYVTGDDSAIDTGKQSELIKDMMKADKVEIISRQYGHNDITDAWWSLTAKGMQRIVCVLAQCSGLGNLKLSGRQLQLCG